MEVGKLTVEYRSTTGKNVARRLRAQGLVPGICYGKGAEPMPISLEPRALKKALDPVKRHNTVIRLTVNGAAKNAELTVMLREYELDALRREVKHVDFVTVDLTKDVHVEVPIVLTGKPAGLIDGGQLHTVHRSMKVICKPDLIPANIEVDVSPLGVGDVLHVRDVKMPEGVRSAFDGGETIASCMLPRAEKVEEVKTEAAAEGAAAAAPAAAGKEGAAAKGGEAKGGEAKPAAGGKEKK